MKLEELDLDSSAVRDVGPLRGMPLKRLGFGYSQVRDLPRSRACPSPT